MMTTEPYLDLANAKRHREKDRSLTDAFYDQQAMAVAQWRLGGIKPQSLRVGELATILCSGTLLRLSKLID